MYLDSGSGAIRDDPRRSYPEKVATYNERAQSNNIYIPRYIVVSLDHVVVILELTSCELESHRCDFRNREALSLTNKRRNIVGTLAKNVRPVVHRTNRRTTGKHG